MGGATGGIIRKTTASVTCSTLEPNAEARAVLVALWRVVDAAAAASGLGVVSVT